MINFFIMLIISVWVSFGISIALVEKSDKWPLRNVRIRLQLLLSKIHWRLPQVLFCTTCTSFWISVGVDVVLFFFCHFVGFFYFFWPLSGFASLCFVWCTIEILNAIDKKQNIINNNYILQQEDKNKNE